MRLEAVVLIFHRKVVRNGGRVCKIISVSICPHWLSVPEEMPRYMFKFLKLYSLEAQKTERTVMVQNYWFNSTISKQDAQSSDHKAITFSMYLD